MPAGLPFRHPAGLLATWFGAGLLRGAPGTWGSLAALPFAVLIVWAFGELGLLTAAGLAFVAGIWASAVVARRSGEEDSPAIVIDEVAGQWLALVPVALDLKYYALAFLLFRAADILKPWPANRADRLRGPVRGPVGVMLDDVFAGLYAGLAVWLIARAVGYESCFSASISVFH
ncbi:MAG: phosphatidylglycerophosphatase A [Alphaproteobacteria bacterium]|jgi:phosphatidylglycerophosphatase A|nr:phosphatidylglycerophosphatase A [Alphaproteobacteria bacterium]